MTLPLATDARSPPQATTALSEDVVDAAAVRLALPPGAPLEGQGVPAAGGGTLAKRTDLFERDVILAELRSHHFRMTDTARALGLERSHLYKKCQQPGIDLRALRSEGE